MSAVLREHYSRARTKVRTGTTVQYRGKMAAMADLIKGTGITPIEVLVNTMRMQYEAGMAPTKKRYKGKPLPPDWDKLKEACQTAKEAASYIHPKLSAVEVFGNMTDDQLDEYIRQQAVAAGVDPDDIPTLIPINEAAQQTVPVYGLPAPQQEQPKKHGIIKRRDA